jgi:hypothetical protein
MLIDPRQTLVPHVIAYTASPMTSTFADRSTRAVDIGSVVYSKYSDNVRCVLDLVSDPVWTATSSPQSAELSSKGMAHSSRSIDQRACHELDDRGGGPFG